MRVQSANCDKEKRGDARYIKYLLARLIRGVLFLSEVGHGKTSVRLRGLGRRIEEQRSVEIGKTGVHRWVRVGYTTIRKGRKKVRVAVISVHGLHRRSVGDKAADAWLRLLAAEIREIEAETDGHWIAAGDFNIGIKKAGRILGGTGFGHGVDGFVISDKMRFKGRVKVDKWGIRHKYTDHPAIRGRVVVA